MKIYTRTGDNGFTSLFGKKRLSKDDSVFEVLGNIDELNSLIGLINSFSAFEKKQILNKKVYKKIDININERLVLVQKKLMNACTDIALVFSGRKPSSGDNPITPEDVEALEKDIDLMNSLLPLLQGFVVPGGCRSGAGLFFARAVCRRTEKSIVKLKNELRRDGFNEFIIPYFNRLSDWLFVLARYANMLSGY